MSRCPDCGMKECCGADMAPRIADLESQLAEANGWLKHYNKTDTERWTDLKEMIKAANAEIEELRGRLGMVVEIVNGALKSKPNTDEVKK